MYNINYEATDENPKCPRVQPEIMKNQTIENAFYHVAGMEAEAFLETGKNDGSYSVTPQFKNRRR